MVDPKSSTDINWVLESVKIGGSAIVGAVVGSVGTIWKSRSRRKNMRRHLYKEIAENYGSVYSTYQAFKKGQSSAFYSISDAVNLSYYEHAQKDMDAFHSIEDYIQILWLYKSFERIQAGGELHDLTQAALAALNGLDILVAIDSDSGKALMKYAPPYVKKILIKQAADIGVGPDDEDDE